MFHIALGLTIAYLCAPRIHPANRTQKVLYCVVLPIFIWSLVDVPHFIVTEQCPIINRIMLSFVPSLITIIIYLWFKVKIRKPE